MKDERLKRICVIKNCIKLRASKGKIKLCARGKLWDAKKTTRTMREKRELEEKGGEDLGYEVEDSK